MFGKDYGKAMERLWISTIEREMKERCKQGVKVQGSDKAARIAWLRFESKVKGDDKQEHTSIKVYK